MAADAEAVGELHEVRIGEIGADDAVAVQALLHVAHVAVGAVVEQDNDDRNAVAHRGRELLHVEHEAAVAAQIATTGTSPSACLAPSAVATPQPSVPW